MKSAKSVALIKKNSEVPSYAVTPVGSRIDEFYISLKYLANNVRYIAFSLYIMVLRHIWYILALFHVHLARNQY